MRVRHRWAWLCWMVVATSCGGDDPAAACEPDTLTACVCEDSGATGERECIEGELGPCVCRRRENPGELCVDDLDCQDGLFCNGIERCEPESAMANDEGCVMALVRPTCDDGIACTVDRCVDGANRCVYSAPDADEDGHPDAQCLGADGEPLGDDCDDDDADRFPGNVEVCEPDAFTHDEDCDAETFGHRDLDGDQAIDARCCNGANCGTDCDDANLARNPEQVELCDLLDNDCDERTDEDAIDVPWYLDADGDGFGDPLQPPVIECDIQAGRSLRNTDCDDTVASVNPSAVEACDGIDNDCDSAVDEHVCQSVCGDGETEDQEECDDGNRLGGDGCGRGCLVEPGFDCPIESACVPICGDGVRLTRFEVCDDGNTLDGDYCASDCSQSTGYCGDGSRQLNEACDDGNVQSGDYCAADCTMVTGSCGDGVVQTNEGCDDGDDPEALDAEGDGCAASCEVEQGYACDGTPSVCGPVCGDGQMIAGEVCDDGNTLDDDYCAADCSAVRGYCGDARLQRGEACDDGNLNDDDGCATCVAVPGYKCTGAIGGVSSCSNRCGNDLVVPLQTCGALGVQENHCCRRAIVAEADTYTASNATTTNYGTAQQLRIQPSVFQASAIQHTYVRFDLSPFGNAEVHAAQFEMTAYTGFAYGNNGNVYVELVDSDTWSETALTWATAPTVSTALGAYWLWFNDINETSTSLQTGRVNTPELLAAVQQRLASEDPAQRRISMRMNSLGYRTVYRSREYTGGAGNPPTLLVTYVLRP